MKNASRLYDALSSFVGQCAWADQRHAYVLVWMVIGVIHEGSVNLTRWLGHVQTRARDAQSTQRRFSRWLHNARIHPTHLYGSLIQSALSSWCDQVLYLRQGYDDAVGYVLRHSLGGGLSGSSHSRDLAGAPNMAVAV